MMIMSFLIRIAPAVVHFSSVPFVLFIEIVFLPWKRGRTFPNDYLDPVIIGSQFLSAIYLIRAIIPRERRLL